MPPIADKAAIRALLHRDPRWCVYALGDLTPRMFEKCRWFTPDLSLVLHDYGTSILFAHGTGSIREAINHVTSPCHLQVQADALEEAARLARVEQVKHMQRFTWEQRGRADDRPRAAGHVVIKRLDSGAVAALQRLYADGESTLESPDFFHPAMVDHGVFAGAIEDGALVAVAGTHLVSRDEGVAAIGNVYTRRDRRGRGYSTLTMAAVLHELRECGTVGLNVRDGNTAAIKVYESLGFEKYCDFREAVAYPAR